MSLCSIGSIIVFISISITISYHHYYHKYQYFYYNRITAGIITINITIIVNLLLSPAIINYNDEQSELRAACFSASRLSAAPPVPAPLIMKWKTWGVVQ